MSKSPLISGEMLPVETSSDTPSGAESDGGEGNNSRILSCGVGHLSSITVVNKIELDGA